MQLAEYRTSVRDILHDPNANFYSVTQVDRWINRARRQVAQTGRCVRQLPPSAGSIASITVNSGGSGYTAATAAISLPDANVINTIPATATVNLSGGAVVSFTITNPGFGYIAPPTVTFTGTGMGAIATPVVTPHICTVPGQEVYPLAALATTFDSITPGLGPLLGIQSVSVAWGALKPTLAKRDFSWLQSYARSGAPLYQSYPRIWAPYGQGTIGSFYLWPIPIQFSAMECDCYFSVLDLSADGTTQPVDLIPEPWNEPAFYYAAYLAYLNAQRTDDARIMLGEHTRLMMQARATVTTDTTPDPYGDP